jgi:hypothetical protein
MGDGAAHTRAIFSAAMRTKGLLISIPIALGAVAAIAIPAASSTTTAQKPPPGPIGTTCTVFPSPGPEVPANAPSLPDQRMWNQNISQAPVDPRSAQIMDGIKGGALHPDFGSPSKYGIPYIVVGADTKAVKTKFRIKSESDLGPYKIPLNAPIEGGKNGKGDRHVIGFDNADCKLYEMYRGFPDKKHKRWKAYGGAIWDLNSADRRTERYTSADAAGLPIFPGLVRYEEVAAGAINHAIRITFATTRDAYIYPAVHCAGATNDPDVVSEGQRLRLKSSFDISGITGQSAVIAKAMQQYGVVVADNGSDWFFSGASDPRFDDDDLNQLKEIPGSAFEVVATEGDVIPC